MNCFKGCQELPFFLEKSTHFKSGNGSEVALQTPYSEKNFTLI